MLLYYSRSNPMGLIVALGDLDQARGDLFWDDGEALGLFLLHLYIRLQTFVYLLFASNMISFTDTQDRGEFFSAEYLVIKVSRNCHYSTSYINLIISYLPKFI